MEETKKLIVLAQNGDKSAKEKLIRENTGLIWSIVKKFSNRGYELDDLFQIGAIGLLKCIDKFNNNYGVKFSTYAVPMIMGEIKRFLRDDGLIKISRPIKEISKKIKYVQENFFKRTGNFPTLNDLADELKISYEELLIAMDSNKNVESIYKTIRQPDGNTTYLIDKIKYDEHSRIIDQITVNDIINKLEDAEKEIILQRYFYDQTQSQIAKKLNISQVQVSRLEKKILLKMKKNLWKEELICKMQLIDF